MKKKNSTKPILVTGSHRSGTTWVARVLSASPHVAYINEPFNLDFPEGRKTFAYWFTYVTKNNQSLYYDYIKKTLSLHRNISLDVKSINSLEDAKKTIKSLLELLDYLLRGNNKIKPKPLFKDPIAIFSAEWLAKTFGMDVLILIRHPAAFASSLKKLNWQFSFRNFVEQPNLMRDHLYRFEKEINQFANNQQDIIDQASLLWKCIYHTVATYMKIHRDWIFLRHEDISRDPLTNFEYLFNRFGLDFSPEIRSIILEYSSPRNPSEQPQDNPFTIKRDSLSNIWNWKNRLSDSEIERIRKSVEEISMEFYSDEDW